jgi:hypothetical protein
MKRVVSDSANLKRTDLVLQTRNDTQKQRDDLQLKLLDGEKYVSLVCDSWTHSEVRPRLSSWDLHVQGLNAQHTLAMSVVVSCPQGNSILLLQITVKEPLDRVIGQRKASVIILHARQGLVLELAQEQYQFINGQASALAGL